LLAVGLVVWFTLLLIPCFCFVLATSQEIVIPLSSAPGHQVRIWLIMEADERGLGVSTATLNNQTDLAFCEQTDNRFLLWQGRAENVSYCECYARSSAEDAWALTSTASDACPA
jgi:hypothetical protein